MKLKPIPICLALAFIAFQGILYWHGHSVPAHHVVHHAAPIIQHVAPTVKQHIPAAKECHDGFYVFPCR